MWKFQRNFQSCEPQKNLFFRFLDRDWTLVLWAVFCSFVRKKPVLTLIIGFVKVFVKESNEIIFTGEKQFLVAKRFHLPWRMWWGALPQRPTTRSWRKCPTVSPPEVVMAESTWLKSQTRGFSVSILSKLHRVWFSSLCRSVAERSSLFIKKTSCEASTSSKRQDQYLFWLFQD